VVRECERKQCCNLAHTSLGPCSHNLGKAGKDCGRLVAVTVGHSLHQQQQLVRLFHMPQAARALALFRRHDGDHFQAVARPPALLALRCLMVNWLCFPSTWPCFQ
jgi:hypothetical protein